MSSTPLRPCRSVPCVALKCTARPCVSERTADCAEMHVQPQGAAAAVVARRWPVLLNFRPRGCHRVWRDAWHSELHGRRLLRLLPHAVRRVACGHTQGVLLARLLTPTACTCGMHRTYNMHVWHAPPTHACMHRTYSMHRTCCTVSDHHGIQAWESRGSRAAATQHAWPPCTCAYLTAHARPPCTCAYHTAYKQAMCALIA
jgi:hypothetical protein